MIDDTMQNQLEGSPIISEQQEAAADQSLQENAQRLSEETPQQKSFKAIREKAERAERERDDALRKLRDIESQKASSQEEDYEIRLGPDDLAEGKHLSKVSQQIKKLQAELNEYRRKSTADTTEALIKAEYPDFDKIVSRDNIEALKNSYPELAQTLNSSNDMYVTAKAAYTLIKKLGISQDTSSSYDAEKEAAQKNYAKPRPLASVSPQRGDSALSQANQFAKGLTDELKKQLLAEMNEARRGY